MLCFFPDRNVMKKVFIIFVTIILIASGIKVGIDRHYCCGELAGIKLTLAGKPAGCGMEGSAGAFPGQTSAGSTCCEDQVVFYSVTGKYLPVYFRLQHPGPGNEHPVFSNLLFGSSSAHGQVSWVLPPGPVMKRDIPLAGICILRI